MAEQTRLSSLQSGAQATPPAPTHVQDSFRYFRNDKPSVKLCAWTVLQIQCVLTSAFRAAGYAFIFSFGLISVTPFETLLHLRRLMGL